MTPPLYRIHFLDGTTREVHGYLWEGRDGSVRFYREGPGLGRPFLIVGPHALHHVELVEEESS